ncbi:hypothetical protein WA158_002635 [Blastocystis sp. Blastoise]
MDLKNLIKKKKLVNEYDQAQKNVIDGNSIDNLSSANILKWMTNSENFKNSTSMAIDVDNNKESQSEDISQYEIVFNNTDMNTHKKKYKNNQSTSNPSLINENNKMAICKKDISDTIGQFIITNEQTYESNFDIGNCIIYWATDRFYVKNNIALYLAMEISMKMSLPLLVMSVFTNFIEIPPKPSQIQLYSQIIQFRCELYIHFIPYLCVFTDDIYDTVTKYISIYKPKYVITEYSTSISYSSCLELLQIDFPRLIIQVYQDLLGISKKCIEGQLNTLTVFPSSSTLSAITSTLSSSLLSLSNQLSIYTPSSLPLSSQQYFWKNHEYISILTDINSISLDSLNSSIYTCFPLLNTIDLYNKTIESITRSIPSIYIPDDTILECDWSHIYMYIQSMNKTLHFEDLLFSGSGLYTASIALSYLNNNQSISSLYHYLHLSPNIYVHKSSIVELYSYIKDNSISIFTIMQYFKDINSIYNTFVEWISSYMFSLIYGQSLYNKYGIYDIYNSIPKEQIIIFKEMTDKFLDIHYTPLDIKEGTIPNQLYNCIIHLYQLYNSIPFVCRVYIIQYRIIFLFHIPPYLFIRPLLDLYTDNTNIMITYDILTDIIQILTIIANHYIQKKYIIDSTEIKKVYIS